jgi:hypothetical protein
VKSETKGSQYFLRYAVNKKRELLLTALLESGATGRREDITWHSPLENDRLGKYREYKDGAAIRLIGLDKKLSAPLAKFWPSRGPVWDALGTGTNGRPILLEAKAHIPEAVSRIKAASKSSIELINKGLALARSRYTRKSQVDWSAPFYQYTNRLAYQFLDARTERQPKQPRVSVLLECEADERTCDETRMAGCDAVNPLCARIAGGSQTFRRL